MFVLDEGPVCCAAPWACKPLTGTWPEAVEVCEGNGFLAGFFFGWKILAAGFLRIVGPGAAGLLPVGVAALAEPNGALIVEVQDCDLLWGCR